MLFFGYFYKRVGFQPKKGVKMNIKKLAMALSITAAFCYMGCDESSTSPATGGDEAAFRYKAYLEEIDYGVSRGLDRNQMERLASLDFIGAGQNLFITGPSGTGKSFIATALGYQACKANIRTLYSNASKLMGVLKVAKAKGTLEAELRKIERCQLLILDDLFLVPLDAKERPLLLDIIEDRHGRKSTIITSQLPVSNWYDAVGDPTVADALLDRIVHTAHRIELTGESMRKIKGSKIK